MAVVALPRPQSTFAGRFRPLPALLGQCHRLIASTVSAGAPSITPATMFERESFTEPPLVVGSPVLSSPTLKLVANFHAIAPAPIPVLGAPKLGQQHRLVARDLIDYSPTISRPRMSVLVFLPDAVGLDVGSPFLDTPALKQRRRHLSVVDLTSRPRLIPPLVGQPIGTTIATKPQRAASITGQHGKTDIIGRKQRIVI